MKHVFNSGVVYEIVLLVTYQHAFHMPSTTCSQATRDQEVTSEDMEARFVEMKGRLKKMTVEMEALQ